MRLLPLLLLLILTGCSTFERDWKATETAGPSDGLAGRWEGTWLSGANGHTGGLRCIITHADSGDLHARYHATYGPCFTFEYDVPLTAWPDGDGYRFSGEADLGWLAGGAYTYEGTVVGDGFDSTYESARDHGTFRMERVD